jgi:hypothetical protein
MGIEITKWAWRQSTPTPTSKLVLLALAEHADQHGVCWPSQARLATMCMVSDRQIREILQKLKFAGLLKMHARSGAGRKTSNLYRLAIDGCQMPDAGSRNSDADGELTGAQYPAGSGSVLPQNQQLEPRASHSQREALVTAGKVGIRGTRLALESCPAEWTEWALAERPDLDPTSVWDSFRDYWVAQPGERGLSSDWAATWRRWVRRERDTENRSGIRRPKGRLMRSQEDDARIREWIASNENGGELIEGEMVK